MRAFRFLMTGRVIGPDSAHVKHALRFMRRGGDYLCRVNSVKFTPWGVKVQVQGEAYREA